MKLSLLDSRFRVVVLDSSKLATTSVSSVFVPLSQPALELVVIDDGAQNNVREEVEEFAVAAADRKVACLVVPTGERAKIAAGRATRRRAAATTVCSWQTPSLPCATNALRHPRRQPSKKVNAFAFASLFYSMTQLSVQHSQTSKV